MFSRLLRLPEDVRARYDTSSLECIVHAAAPCPVHVKQAMIDWLGPIITEYYGATEAQRLHLLRQRAVARPSGHGRPADPRRAADPRRRRRAVPDRAWTGRSGSAARPRSSTSRTRSRRPRAAARDGQASSVGDVGHVDEDGLPVPDRPQDLHDHLRRRQHLPAGDREPARRPPRRPGRRRDRRAQRGPRRGGQGRRAAGRSRAAPAPSSRRS